MYIQPHLTSELLSRMAYSNQAVLKKLKLVGKLPADLKLGNNATLHSLAMLGAENHTLAWPVWQTLWKELNTRADSKNARPSVLIAIDSVNHWMGPTKYRSAEYNTIHAQQFNMIKHLTRLLFAQSEDELANGGMVIAATSGSNSPSLPSLDILLRQLAARAAGTAMTDPNFPMPQPYSKPDQRVLSLFKDTDETTLTTLKGLSRLETRGLLDYFAKGGIFKESITDTVVGQMRGLSGGGIVGEMAKFGTRTSGNVAVHLSSAGLPAPSSERITA